LYGTCQLGFLAEQIDWRGLGNLRPHRRKIDQASRLGLAWGRRPNHHRLGFRIRTGFPCDKQSRVDGNGPCPIEEGTSSREMQIGQGRVAILAHEKAAPPMV
jgi:hypothetical protein